MRIKLRNIVFEVRREQDTNEQEMELPLLASEQLVDWVEEKLSSPEAYELLGAWLKKEITNDLNEGSDSIKTSSGVNLYE